MDDRVGKAMISALCRGRSKLPDRLDGVYAFQNGEIRNFTMQAARVR
jgi:hypothetical protein